MSFGDRDTLLGNVPTGKDLAKLARSLEFVPGPINGCLEVAVRLAHRRTYRKTIRSLRCWKKGEFPGPSLMRKPVSPGRDYVPRLDPIGRDCLKYRFGTRKKSYRLSQEPAHRDPLLDRPGPSLETPAVTGMDNTLVHRAVVRPGVQDTLRKSIVGHHAQDHVAEPLGRQF